MGTDMAYLARRALNKSMLPASTKAVCRLFHVWLSGRGMSSANNWYWHSFVKSFQMTKINYWHVKFLRGWVRVSMAKLKELCVCVALMF